MKVKTLLRSVTTVALASALGVAVAAAPAAAGGLTAQWFGTIHVTTSTSTTYGGWVDGNGPDSYIAWADCNDGSLATGVERWAGDRRGSFAYCASEIVSGSGHRGFFLIDN